MSGARQLAAAIVALVAGFAAVHVTQAGGPEGRWLTQKKDGVVEIYRCADAVCGRLLWFEKQALQDNPRALDLNNPSAPLRNRSLCGLVILWGFKPDGPDHWSGGSAYDPDSGNTYSGEMTMKADGHLSLRGYIGISLFGRSEEWTRSAQPTPRCPPE